MICTYKNLYVQGEVGHLIYTPFPKYLLVYSTHTDQHKITVVHTCMDALCSFSISPVCMMYFHACPTKQIYEFITKTVLQWISWKILMSFSPTKQHHYEFIIKNGATVDQWKILHYAADFKNLCVTWKGKSGKSFFSKWLVTTNISFCLSVCLLF